MATTTRKKALAQEIKCKAYGIRNTAPAVFKDGNKLLMSCPYEYTQGINQKLKICTCKVIDEREDVLAEEACDAELGCEKEIICPTCFSKGFICEPCWSAATIEEHPDLFRDEIRKRKSESVANKSSSNKSVGVVQVNDESYYVNDHKDLEASELVELPHVSKPQHYSRAELTPDESMSLRQKILNLMIHAEDWIRSPQSKLSLKNYWNDSNCGGHMLLGTSKCIHVPWYVITYLRECTELPDSDKDYKLKTSNEVDKFLDMFCMCPKETRFQHNISLLSEFIHEVVLIHPYAKTKAKVKNGELIEEGTIEHKWNKIIKKLFDRNNHDTMLGYFAPPAKYESIKKPIDKFLISFNKVYTNPGINNHRWGYGDEEACIKMLCDYVTKIGNDPNINLFDDKKKLIDKILNYFNNRQVNGLQSRKADANFFKICRDEYEYFFVGVPELNENDDSEEYISKCYEANERALKEVYKSITDTNLYKEYKKSDHRENREDEEFDFVTIGEVASSSKARKRDNSDVLTPNVLILPKKNTGNSTHSQSSRVSVNSHQVLNSETNEVDTVVLNSALLGQLATFNSTIESFKPYDDEDEELFEQLKKKRRKFIKEKILID